MFEQLLTEMKATPADTLLVYAGAMKHAICDMSTEDIQQCATIAERLNDQPFLAYCTAELARRKAH